MSGASGWGVFGLGVGGQGGCERRIEVFVKIQKKKHFFLFFFWGGGGWVGLGGGLGWGGQGGCECDISMRHTHTHTDKPKPVCPPPFQSWKHKKCIRMGITIFKVRTIRSHGYQVYRFRVLQ